MTGECGWVQPPDLACTMPCRMDSDRGMKQRPLQTQVTKWSLFFPPYFNFNEQGGPKGQASPSARTLEGLLPGATRSESLAVLLPAPGRAGSALGVGTGVWGRGGGLAPVLAGPGNPGGVKNTHYLFFGFVNGKRDFRDGAGRACSVVAGCPESRWARALCPEPRGQTASSWA